MLDNIAELNARFESLLEHARRNEKTLKKFRDFEISLLYSETPAQFFNTLLKAYRHEFGWDQVTVTLVDPDYGIRRLLSHTGDELESNPDILFLEDAGVLKEIYHDATLPILSPFDPELHEMFFPGGTVAPASVALLPITSRHQVAGSFNIGSMNEDRFNENTGKEFLQHLAAIITVCIDNHLSKEHLKYLGLIDNLTGVNNRRFFEQRLQEETARVNRSNTPISCLFVDIDHFKKINDTYGHQAGDQVLRHVAQIIREQVRAIDIVARYGGEEFTVILLQAGAKKAEEIAERIRTTIEQGGYYTDSGQRVPLTASIGTNSLMPEECQTDLKAVAKKFVEQADQALYAAKNSGRNKTVGYSSLAARVPA
ncbi:MAG: GGDEF domain-containing protein [Gammaproteobacteria bacterium]